jgi:two-component system, cell cycle response regulator DivK
MKTKKKSIILVVDDNDSNRKLINDILTLENYDVHEARDAFEVAGHLDNHSPDLILMDIAMPGLDGLELTRKLKSHDHTQHYGIVAVSSHASESDKLRAFEAGCLGHIGKPINTRLFPKQIAEFLQIAKDAILADGGLISSATSSTRPA